MAELKDFLKPESVTTSGVAGGTIMTVASTLYVQFDIDPKICAMILSALISFAIVYQIKEKIPIKAVYLIINTLVLFSVSVGGNTLSNKAAQSEVAALLPSLITSAYAHEGEGEHVHESLIENEVDLENPAELKKYVEQLKIQNEKLEAQLQQQEQEVEVKDVHSVKKKRSFSDSW